MDTSPKTTVIFGSVDIYATCKNKEAVGQSIKDMLSVILPRVAGKEDPTDDTPKVYLCLDDSDELAFAIGKFTGAFTSRDDEPNLVHGWFGKNALVKMLSAAERRNASDALRERTDPCMVLITERAVCFASIDIQAFQAARVEVVLKSEMAS